MNGNAIAPTAEVRGVKETAESVRNLAVKYISKYDAIKEEIKTKTDAFSDTLLQDQEYADLDKELEETRKAHTLRKEQLLTRESIAAQAQELKELRVERTDIKASLSDYLFEVERQEQLTLFDIEDGQGVKRKVIKVANIK